MENQNQPTSEATPATHNNQPKGDVRNPYPLPTSCGPLWVGLTVLPLAGQQDVFDVELIWLRDFEHAERLCAERVVQQVVFEWNGTRVQTDYADAESFADFVNGCRDELALNPPVFDGPAEERLIRDAVCFLYADSERLARTKGDAR